jgi:Transposase DDE domain group 1
MGRFETKWLSRPENLAALADLPGQWIDKVHQRRPPKMIVLDIDSSESPTYGEQEGSAYNGHFACTCYHPLFVFNQFGDVERCALRRGNVHSADGWRAVLEPVMARYRRTVKRLYFRGDAALLGAGSPRHGLRLSSVQPNTGGFTEFKHLRKNQYSAVYTSALVLVC